MTYTSVHFRTQMAATSSRSAQRYLGYRYIELGQRREPHWAAIRGRPLSRIHRPALTLSTDVGMSCRPEQKLKNIAILFFFEKISHRSQIFDYSTSTCIQYSSTRRVLVSSIRVLYEYMYSVKYVTSCQVVMSTDQYFST